MHYHLSRQSQELIRQAKEVAREYGFGYVGTEHLLLAIVREGTSPAAEVLRRIGAHEYATEAEVQRQIESRRQETWVVGRLPGTPHFRDVLSKAACRARGTGNWQIEPEHIVFGLLDEPDCVACQTLQALGVTVGAFRDGLTGLRSLKP